MDSERREKQEFLKEKIMDEGYSASDFLEYLFSQKSGGDQLDNWTMTELQKSVQKYLQSIDREIYSTIKTESESNILEVREALSSMKQHREDPRDAHEQPQIEEKKIAFQSRIISPFSPHIEAMYKTIKTSISSTQDELECVKHPVNEFTKNKPTILIIDHRVQSGGVFSSDVIYYQLETKPIARKVERTYKDCLWLREQLRRNYPGSIFPPLDKKCTRERTLQHEIDTAMGNLQNFFSELVRDKLIRSSSILHSFLLNTDYVKFQQFKIDIEKMRVPFLPGEYRSLSGKIKVDLAPEVFFLPQELINFAKSGREYYSKIMFEAFEISKLITELSNRYNNISNLFKEFAKAHHTIQRHDLADLFYVLRIVHQSTSDFHRKQATIFNEKFCDFFRYYLEELNSFTELNIDLENSKKEYLKLDGKLSVRKNKLFTAGKVQSWELEEKNLIKYSKSELMINRDLAFQLMLPKQTAELEEKKLRYGYFANMMLSEGKRIMKKNYHTICKHFTQTSEEIAREMKEIYQMWEDISQHLTHNLSVVKSQCSSKKNIIS